jgi:hypothetical protein
MSYFDWYCDDEAAVPFKVYGNILSDKRYHVRGGDFEYKIRVIRS